MSAESAKDAVPIRLVFELARADHPRLYDDLIRFHKGVKRVNRLRVLAYDGLLAQIGHFVAIGPAPQARKATADAGEGGGDVTNDVFAPSHPE
jgi:hypothetical protein